MPVPVLESVQRAYLYQQKHQLERSEAAYLPPARASVRRLHIPVEELRDHTPTRDADAGAGAASPPPTRASARASAEAPSVPAAPGELEMGPPSAAAAAVDVPEHRQVGRGRFDAAVGKTPVEGYCGGGKWGKTSLALLSTSGAAAAATATAPPLVNLSLDRELLSDFFLKTGMSVSSFLVVVAVGVRKSVALLPDTPTPPNRNQSTSNLRPSEGAVCVRRRISCGGSGSSVLWQCRPDCLDALFVPAMPCWLGVRLSACPVRRSDHEYLFAMPCPWPLMSAAVDYFKILGTTL